MHRVLCLFLNLIIYHGHFSGEANTYYLSFFNPSMAFHSMVVPQFTYCSTAGEYCYGLPFFVPVNNVSKNILVHIALDANEITSAG